MEHIKRCKVCGHIFCYTDKDVQDQTLNAVSSIFSGMAQIGAAASGSILNMHMAGSQAERVRNQQVDLNRCPNCNSTDLEIITKEELQKIAAAEALKNGADIKINANASTESLLKRAEIFLEDSDWPTANAYCNAVLDVEPDNAEAYLGKMMAELQITKREKLADLQEPFDSNDNYKKIIRFGSEELVNEICGYVENIKNERQYKSLKKLLDSAKTEGDYVNLASKFKVLAGYKDSEEISVECFQKAEVLKEERERKAEEARIAAEKARIIAERKAEANRIAEEAKMKKSKKIVAVILPILAVIIIAVVIFTTVIQPQNEYNAAVALMEEGRYEEAITAFEAMDGYKDSAEQIVNCQNAILEPQYQSAVALMEEGKYEEAITAFKAMEGYKDSVERIVNCKNGILDQEYQSAITLMEEEKYEESIAAFEAMNGYKDSNKKIVEIKTIIISNANIGDIIYFGNYHGENEWLVLDKEETHIFVISIEALDCKRYDDDCRPYTDDIITWEKCSLRKWLNNEFINEAFSAEEQNMIITTKVSTPDYLGYTPMGQEYEIDGGNDTEDKVFLLSVDEVKKYFPSDEERECEPSIYAKKQGADVYDNGNCKWWLRSIGMYEYLAAYINYDSYIYDFGGETHNHYGVRPAMWIDLSVIE